MIGLFKVFLFLLCLVAGIGLSAKIKKDRVGSWEKIETKPTLGLGILLVLFALIILPAVGAVPAGTRGVVLKFGAFTGRVLNEGLYIVTPVVNNVELMSVQTVAHAVEAAAASKDLQDVTTQITLNYSLDPAKVGDVYRNLRRDYQVRIIDPAIQESVKASISQFDAERLVVDRPKVKETIEQSLKTRLAVHGILVDTISITDFKFSGDFTKAIEQKVTAVQDALRAQNELKKIEFEAQQKVVKARAEAEALRLQGSVVSPMLIQLRSIEVQKAAIDKWNGVMPTTVTGSGPVPILDVFKK